MRTAEDFSLKWMSKTILLLKHQGCLYRQGVAHKRRHDLQCCQLDPLGPLLICDPVRGMTSMETEAFASHPNTFFSTAPIFH